jgi:hypothetical protein
MDWIAEYREARIECKRHFELYEDFVRVRGSFSCASDFDVTIKLRNLLPEFGRIRLRSKLFVVSMWECIIAAIVYAILISGLKMEPFGHVPGLVLMLATAGAIMMIVTFRKVEYASFKTEAGVTVLDIGRCGPDKERFEEFVEMVVRQIRKARQDG